MDTRFEPNHSSEAMHLHKAEECIIQQQKLAEGLEALGHRRQARQAREMLATFVKSYLATQDCREKMDFQSFSALTKTWLKLTVDDQQAFLDALSKVPKLNAEISAQTGNSLSPERCRW